MSSIEGDTSKVIASRSRTSNDTLYSARSILPHNHDQPLNPYQVLLARYLLPHYPRELPQFPKRKLTSDAYGTVGEVKATKVI